MHTNELDEMDWTYVIQVEARDFILRVSEVRFSIRKKRVSSPSVTLIGSPLYQVSNDIPLRAEGQFSHCSTFQSPFKLSPLKFSWSLNFAQPSVEREIFGKPSVEQTNDAGSPHLYISASTLKPGHYTNPVTVVATDETFRTTNAILAFAIVQAPLQAVIDGGGFQTVSFSKDFLLNGTRSKDLAQPASIFDGTYSWSFVFFSKPC